MLDISWQSFDSITEISSETNAKPFFGTRENLGHLINTCTNLIGYQNGYFFEILFLSGYANQLHNSFINEQGVDVIKYLNSISIGSVNSFVE